MWRLRDTSSLVLLQATRAEGEAPGDAFAFLSKKTQPRGLGFLFKIRSGYGLVVWMEWLP